MSKKYERGFAVTEWVIIASVVALALGAAYGVPVNAQKQSLLQIWKAGLEKTLEMFYLTLLV